MARLRTETALDITVLDESVVFKAASGATAPLVEFKNSSGTVVADVAADGTVTVTSISGVTKTMVGLANVDNTTDANKPVSTAQQTALDLKAPLASPTFTGTVTIPTGASITAPTGLVKGDVGLISVDDTADIAKPVSTATQTALDLKAPLASPAFTGTVTLPASTVTTSMIVDDAVTQAKLADRAVGSAQLGGLTLDAQTGTTYTLVLTDAHKLVTQNNASAITTTIPPNSSVAFEVGDQVNLLQLGAGQVTVAAGAGVTIRSEGNKLKLKDQYAAATCIKIASDEWVLVGNLEA